MRPQPIKLLLSAALMLLPLATFALPSDREQPIDIEADHAELDDQNGVTQYKGNAILTQGTLRIEGDVITFYYDENKQLKKAVAEGNLATYRQVHKQGEAPVRARALQMEYYAKSQKIYLLGKGHVWQGGDEFTGNKIEYDITKNVVTANSAPVNIGDKKITPSGRIHIIIQPPSKRAKQSKADTPAPTTQAATKVPAAPVGDAGDKYPRGLTVTRLNVRTGPGTQYQKLGTFRTATEVIILTRQNNWLQVRGMINDKTVIGWVNGRYIQSGQTGN